MGWLLCLQNSKTSPNVVKQPLGPIQEPEGPSLPALACAQSRVSALQMQRAKKVRLPITKSSTTHDIVDRCIQQHGLHVWKDFAESDSCMQAAEAMDSVMLNQKLSEVHCAYSSHVGAPSAEASIFLVSLAPFLANYEISDGSALSRHIPWLVCAVLMGTAQS